MCKIALINKFLKHVGEQRSITSKVNDRISVPGKTAVSILLSDVAQSLPLPFITPQTTESIMVLKYSGLKE